MAFASEVKWIQTSRRATLIRKSLDQVFRNPNRCMRCAWPCVLCVMKEMTRISQAFAAWSEVTVLGMSVIIVGISMVNPVGTVVHGRKFLMGRRNGVLVAQLAVGAMSHNQCWLWEGHDPSWRWKGHRQYWLCPHPHHEALHQQYLTKNQTQNQTYVAARRAREGYEPHRGQSQSVSSWIHPPDVQESGGDWVGATSCTEAYERGTYVGDRGYKPQNATIIS